VSVEFASRDGTPLHGLLWRAPVPAAGLLILHGMQSHAGWFEVSGTPDHLAANGVTVFAFDRRGSGHSGGERGHAPSSSAFLDDLDAGRSELTRALAEQCLSNAPLHALANCFGTRILLPYLADHPGAFRSAVLTAPAFAMSRAADYDIRTSLRILLANAQRRFATPLHDELFVSSGPLLEWIRADALSLREVTAGFLRATARLTRRMKRAAKNLELPILVILGEWDAMVVNDRIRRDFVARYRGPIEVLELDGEHYLDFTDRQPELTAAVSDWIRARSAGAGP
jgi:alpha-beta hydrolase superfamily lysophospholipase